MKLTSEAGAAPKIKVEIELEQIHSMSGILQIMVVLTRDPQLVTTDKMVPTQYVSH